ncbi:hypothetical protein DSM25558_3808 [Agrobacterium sp. DSM 25558]|nr:hypothetical protein DSM25558_3808 [Agrobacterium sp. DSM 25558]
MCGIDTKKIANYKFLKRFHRDRKEWLSQGGSIDKQRMILEDFADNAGVAKGHYFHQDLLVAKYIFEAKPERHIDVGSRVDGFVAHVASFREIEVLDVQPLPPVGHSNIKFRQADLTQETDGNITDSLSCLHAIEHFGLGRYGDPVDVDGHRKGIANLVKMLKPGGTLYISFPIAERSQVHFNAHRVFSPAEILSYAEISGELHLQSFDYVNDKGELVLNQLVHDSYSGLRFGCGIYKFKKNG